MTRHRPTVAAGVLAAALIVLFAYLSPGLALWLTFIPAMVIAYACHLATTNRRLPDPARVLPVYLVGLAWQFLHFGEEFMNGFNRRWPTEVFGAQAMTLDLFVWINMISYAAFAMGALAIYRGWRVPLLIAWFFAIMGAMGNAIGHPVYDLVSGDLAFPGIVTSLGYWIIGPVLVHRLWTAALPPLPAAPRPVPVSA
ncbi:HXXEE domain-containing protein [Nonomuraea sp. FMUSA5-5]|uniref:HXXEE domain-containing protein n=1 Tax=Nonomuraea composti TaxID=2720023 RepID=A0ABX1B0R1_9ACTN|nr:HXXEE domain-containing protein [Nonomuraea sp. FMUSA5-5]NJP91435.1 HXXEE domain-containing protein [Nonomuraea sp. FMUSA5-5]